MDYMRTLATLSLASRLRRLSEQLFADVAIIYQQLGLNLNPSYFPLLNLINNKGPMGITQASDKLSVSHPAVSKLANKMIREGYLSKTDHPTDKRACHLSLTKQSLQLIQQATPIWQSLKKQLDYLESLQTTPLLCALNQFEDNLLQLNLSQTVLQDLKRSRQPVTIVNWHSDYKNDFKILNTDWINEYFSGQLTATDEQALNYPENYYLSRGGYLYFAKQGGKIVGCIALLPSIDNRYEISKMAVSSELQGQGIGRLLLLTALNKTRELLANSVYLESNRKLTRAITLYQHFGFIELPHPQGKSEYQRADVYMELKING